jgi:hypothetical protein
VKPSFLPALTGFTKSKLITRVASLRTRGTDLNGRGPDAENLRTYLVDGAITLAHELVHCFMGLLSGYEGLGTPLRVRARGWGEPDDEKGEAGRLWGHMVFEGWGMMQEEQMCLRKRDRAIWVDPAAIRATILSRFQVSSRHHWGWCPVVRAPPSFGEGRGRPGSARARRRENITIVKTSSPSTTPPSDRSGKAIKTQQGSGSGAHRTPTAEPHAGAAKAASGVASGPVGLSGRTRNGPAPARPKLQIPESHGGSVTQVSAPTSSTQVRTTPPAVKNPTPTARNLTAATRTPHPSAPAITPATASSSVAGTPSRGLILETLGPLLRFSPPPPTEYPRQPLLHAPARHVNGPPLRPLRPTKTTAWMNGVNPWWSSTGHS